MALKHLIQNKLLDFVEESETFYEVSYDSNNRASLSTNPKKGSDVLASRHANEIAVDFAPDARHGRDRKLIRSNWAFLLRVKFKTEVSLEDFEQAWLDSPPILSREDTSSKQVTLLLVSSRISHPPQQSSSTGTAADFTLLAELSRN